jgi:hypothetical protein
MERLRDSRFDRRQMIKSAFAVPLILSGQGSGVEQLPQVESTVEKIKYFETTIGDTPMTFEAARTYAPLVVDLFHQTTSSITSPDVLNANIFFIHGEGKFSDCEMPPRDFILQLKTNYPETEFKDELDRLPLTMIPGITNDTGQTFIYLPTINNTDSGTASAYEYTGQKVSEVKSSPSIRFRNILIHELFHLNSLY